MAKETILICTCEETMPLDKATIARGCKGEVKQGDQLCRSQLDFFKTVLGDSSSVLVGCTQEAPVFTETAEDMGFAGTLTFANIREQAGWSDQAQMAAPKMAALLAAATEIMPPILTTTLESSGVALVYGPGALAIEVGKRLAEHLDITVLLSETQEVLPPDSTDFPVIKGRIVSAKGVLGSFELAIDDYALPSPSSRRGLSFGPSRNGATSACDLVIDLSGRTPLFPAHELREGYLRADPRVPAEVEKIIGEASHLVGTFDKPRYINFAADLCAHSRSKITGCTRCLDLCPTGAITPNGDHVAIDAAICAGCGACAAHCPTGAASYALPPADAVMRRLGKLLSTYRTTGGTKPVVLFHDSEHGAELVNLLARYGNGLPANVLPLMVNEVTQIGIEVLTAAFAYGAEECVLLTRDKPKHDPASILRVVETANAILGGLGYGAGVRILGTDDPDALGTSLRQKAATTATVKPSAFIARGEKRSMLEQSMREVHRAAPAPVDVIALAQGAPFGTVHVDEAACTLCLACVSACPAAALTDNPEQPMLRFTESLCVQCGLCAKTCPEKAITLEPRLDFVAWAEPKRVKKQEEPFHCVECGKAFGTKSAIERVKAKLEGHWMYSGQHEGRRRALMMCEDCRTTLAVNEGFDPTSAPARPRVRTAADYAREQAEGKDDLH